MTRERQRGENSTGRSSQTASGPRTNKHRQVCLLSRKQSASRFARQLLKQAAMKLWVNISFACHAGKKTSVLADVSASSLPELTRPSPTSVMQDAPSARQIFRCHQVGSNKKIYFFGKLGSILKKKKKKYPQRLSGNKELTLS